MRLLVLSVDRDNDLGRKTGIQAPVIGREELVRAATALAVADPEEADANGMFAAVHEYDAIVANPEAYGASAVFVAAATGHIREGTQADAAMAHQIDQILAATNADHVILVSDGGEDEHVLPIIQTRLKVDGIKRVVVKQARNLEGVVYLFHRLMSDEKLQRRFFLPLAFLLVAAGVAMAKNQPQVFVAACLFLGAFYIFVQVFKWQQPIGNALARIGAELQAGKLSFVASLMGLGVIAWGGVQTLRGVDAWYRDHPATPHEPGVYTVLFLQLVFWYVAGAVLVVVAGRILDELVRERRVNPGYLRLAVFVMAVGVVLSGALDAAREHWVQEETWTDLVTAQLLTQFFFGGFLLVVGLIMHRYNAQMVSRRRPMGAEANPQR